MKILLTFLGLTISISILAQDPFKEAEAEFEQSYDEPYTVNKFFIGFQPFYGELFATNVNAGFGIDAQYFYKQTADFHVHFRKSYAGSFYDLNHENARKNSSVDNSPAFYNYLELGMNYHIKDYDDHGQTKMIHYKKTYTAAQWASQVPERLAVPCRIRKVIGARIGGIMWNSTIDFSNALQQDGKTNLDFGNGNFDNSVNIFTNIHSAGLYIGGSMTWIKNIAITFNDGETALDDGILNLFADILYAPYLKIDDVQYQGNNYTTSILKLNSFGFRVGIDGKFNRKFSWGYGGEIGYRPTVAHLGFFAGVKITLPLYGTNFEKKVEESTDGF